VPRARSGVASTSARRARDPSAAVSRRQGACLVERLRSRPLQRPRTDSSGLG
jgi:hypothetical protein